MSRLRSILRNELGITWLPSPYFSISDTCLIILSSLNKSYRTLHEPVDLLFDGCRWPSMTQTGQNYRVGSRSRFVAAKWSAACLSLHWGCGWNLGDSTWCAHLFNVMIFSNRLYSLVLVLSSVYSPICALGYKHPFALMSLFLEFGTESTKV